MRNERTFKIQLRLSMLGFNPGPLDGVMGPKTEKAIIEFKQSQGLRARPYIGPITWSRLFGPQEAVKSTETVPTAVPWVNLAGKWLGTHETDRRLAEFLASDGSTVGDPDDIPWCGDLVQTCIKNTLPDEVFGPTVGKNPFLAANYAKDFGVPLKELRYGAIVSLWRGSPTSWKGHVAFAVGYDPKRKRIRIRGGNQSDRVTDTWVAENRVRKNGIRAPKTYQDLPPIPIMDASGAVLSTNEA